MDKSAYPYTSVPVFISRDTFESGFSSGLYKDWFTDKEMRGYESGKNILGLACRYLLKKEIIGFSGITARPGELEILNDSKGRPVLHYNSGIEMELVKKGISSIKFSFTHSIDLAAVLVVFER